MAPRFTYDELITHPTLAQGQADDLKWDDGEYRVWLSRCGVEDGEPFEHTATVERLEEGRWVQVERYDADVIA